MSVISALAVFMLCTVKVQCVQPSPACPRKESYPGVLTLNAGSEVILGCRGDVTVDGVLLVMGTKPKERPERRGDVTSHWRAQKAREIPGTTKNHLPEPETVPTAGKYNINTANVTYGNVSKTGTKYNPVMNIADEQMGSGRDFQAVNQFAEPSSVGSVIDEGGPISVTMEMGLSTDRSTEYEEEEYDEKMEGLRVTRSVKRQAQWMKNGELMRGEHGGVLRLPALHFTDSGNYSCYRRGKLVSSVQISVGVPPVSPTLSCHKKSHISKIRCEWISRQPIIPQPQCYLLHRKGLQKITRVNCSYSAKSSRCWCVLPNSEDGRNLYTAKLCVTNTAGNATSPPYNYIPQNIIKPDPPTLVAVTPVKFEPHTLRVSWSLPATWKQSYYYSLQFQLRYRRKHAKQYQQVDPEYTELLWLISDALPNVEYEVQVRAKDEYDGQWSDWTSPVYAHTWTASTTDPPDISTSLEPFWLFPEGSGGSEEEDVKHADGSNRLLWVHVLWLVGFSLLIIIIILSVYAVRRRMPFMPKKSKERLSSTSTCSSPSPLFQQPLITPRSSCQGKEGEGVHLHNVDYFFPLCESYRS